MSPREGDALESDAPTLSLEQLRRELERLHGRPHRTLRTAVFARLLEPPGPDERVELSANGTPRRFRVVQARGELDLRRELSREEGEATAYVVPFARALPRDIEATLAGGRLHLPEAENLLARRFGARTITPRVRGSRLRALALREGSRVYARGDAASVDLDDAWLAFVRERLRVPHLEGAAQLLAGALLDRDRRGPALAELLDQVKDAREELASVLERRMGPSGPAILAAWLGDRAVELGAMVIVGEATRAILTGGGGPSFTLLTAVLDVRIVHTAGHPLRSLREKEGTAGLARALVELGHHAPGLWARLAGASNDPLRRAILGEAEKVLGGEQVRPLAAGSNRLPMVFEARCAAFVDALPSAFGAEERAIAAVDDAAAALLAHDLAREDERLREQVTMAARLAAFLGDPDANGLAARADRTASPRAEVLALATFQATIGGWVDWARQVVRGDVTGPLGRGLLPLLAEVDRVRDGFDERFARAYARLVGAKGDRAALRGPEAVAGSTLEAVPIEDLVARMGLDLLERGPDLRLLVLVLDGMSTANLAELWARFDPENEGGAPVPRTSLVAVSAGLRRPVIAHVPTITKLSRSALFAGRPVAPGESLDTQRDGERLAAHAGVKRLGERPVVLLRKDILKEGGGLADDAAATVRGDTRIVAVVVNAIDDQLKGSAQLRVELSADHILPLRDLLDAADNTGRLVLIASDHGHISSQRFVGQAARTGTSDETEGSARHRGLARGEAALADEIELPAGALSAADPRARVAVAIGERVRYTSLLHAGEHGGASLAEVVAPAVLLAPAGLLPDLRDLGVVEQPVMPPDFWDRGRAQAKRAALAAAQGPPARTSTHSTRPPPAVETAKKAVQTSLGFTPTLAEALFKSQLFKRQIQAIPEGQRGKVELAIALLVRSGGRVTRDHLAAQLKLEAGGSSARVIGFLTSLERVLNDGDEPVVGTDPGRLVVTLDLPRLRAVFLEDEGG